MVKCKCGCGEPITKKGNVYIHGHNHKGKTYKEIYGKLSDEQKNKRRIAIQGTKRPDVKGILNPSKRPEVKIKIKEGVKNSWLKNPKNRTTEKVIKKIRKTCEERGHWTEEKNLKLFELYKRKVKKHTNISIKEKYSKENLKNIGRTKKHIDHIFSVQQGFLNGILPSIIGCKSNIRILDSSLNIKKHTKCDIDLDNLFEKYEREVIK